MNTCNAAEAGWLVGHFPSGSGRTSRVLAWVVAIGAHVAALLAVVDARSPVAAPPPLELEVVPPPAPPPTPDEPEPSKPPVPEPEPPPPSKAAANPPATPRSAPRAAAAPRVVTSSPDSPAAQEPTEPVDFASDPNGGVFSSGVVAVGGKGRHGVAGAVVNGRQAPVRAAVSTPPAPDKLVPLSSLRRRPSLRSNDPCRGYFPKTAFDNKATVQLALVIGKRGDVRRASLVKESPAGQGFGAAALRCMKAQRLDPGLDATGSTVSTSMRVNVTFRR